MTDPCKNFTRWGTRGGESLEQAGIRQRLDWTRGQLQANQPAPGVDPVVPWYHRGSLLLRIETGLDTALAIRVSNRRSWYTLID